MLNKLDPNEGLNWLIDSGLAINPKNNKLAWKLHKEDARIKGGGGWSNQAGQLGIYNAFMNSPEHGGKIPEDKDRHLKMFWL